MDVAPQSVDWMREICEAVAGSPVFSMSKTLESVGTVPRVVVVLFLRSRLKLSIRITELRFGVVYVVLDLAGDVTVGRCVILWCVSGISSFLSLPIGAVGFVLQWLSLCSPRL